MSTFGYIRELKKYEEVDEDDLLATLSSEELQELERELADLDLDDNIPTGLKQRDQTTKIPTGMFDRDALLKYWEDANDEENLAVSGGQDGRLLTTSDACEAVDSDRRKMSHHGRKAGRSDATAVEVEGKDELKGESLGGNRFSVGRRRTESTSRHLDVPLQRATGNPVVIDKALEQILRNDPSITELNLNNAENVSQCSLLHFAEALSTNTHVHFFSLANTHADDRVAFAIAKMLRKNRSIKNLNIESNFVSGQGILALLAALQHNSTLEELRFHNQRHICGGKVEMEMVQLLRENTTLLKLGYQFELPGPRMTVTSILTRNQDQHRQKRLQKKNVSQTPTETSASKKSTHHSFQNQKGHISLPTPDPPPVKTVDTEKHQESSSSTKAQVNQGKAKQKLKKGSNDKESSDIFKELKNTLRRQDEPSHLLQKSTHGNLMAAIRGSSVSALKKVKTPTLNDWEWISKRALREAIRDPHCDLLSSDNRLPPSLSG